MSFWKPNGKGSQTVTAKCLEAWAADAQNAVNGLKKAAECYREGDVDSGRMYAHGAVRLFHMILTVYRNKHGHEDMRT